MKAEAREEDLQAWIDSLRAGGIRLWEEGGTLRFRAPEGALNEALRAKLRARRADLLAHFARAESSLWVPDPAAAHAPFPLTEVQSAYLVGRGSSVPYGDVGAHAYVEYALPEIDPLRVEPALARLIDLHAALRTVFHPEGQEVLAEVPAPPVPVHEMRELSGAQQEARLANLRDALSHRRYDPSHWPLFALEASIWPGELRLHLSVDLLVADFAGVQQLLGELSQLCLGGDALPPPAGISFRDYVLATQRLVATERHARDRAYWMERLPSLPPPPELPVIARSAAAAGCFRRLEVRLDAVATESLRARAAERNLTLSTVFLAAYADVIARWSAKPRFTLNVPIFAKRPLHPQLERVVGDFTSVTLLAVEAMPETSFAERAKQLGERLLEDLEHSSFSGVQLLRARRSETGEATSALMPVVFTSTLNAASFKSEQAEPGRIVYGATQTPQVWIDCQVMALGGEVLLSWDVREGVFPDGFCEAGFASLAQLVRMLANADAPWNEQAPLRLPAEQLARRRPEREHDSAPRDLLLHERVLARVEAQPEQVALITSGAALTFADLGKRAYAVAAALVRTGLRAGERVAVLMDKGWEQVVAVLGIGIAGGTYVPIDTVHPAARRAAMLASAECKLILTRSSQRALAAGVACPVLSVDALESGTVAARRVSADEAAYVIFTSGSTGTPKGVVVSHRAAGNTLDDIVARYRVSANDRVLGLAQLGFDLSVFDVFGVLGAGGALVLPEAERRSDPSHWLALLADHGVTLWNSVPAQLQMLQDHLESAPTHASLAALRLALLSGDWIPVELPDRVRRTLPQLQLVSLGGATEAAIWSIAHDIREPVDTTRPSIPYGRALTGQSLRVLDDALCERPDWVPGELYISGAGLALGYLDAQQTRERFVIHPRSGERLYRTGDLGRWLPDGEIEFLGRGDQQVKLRGHRVELGEIEVALSADSSLAAAQVVAVGEGLRKSLVGFVQPAREEPAPRGGLAARAKCASEAFASALPAARVEAFVAKLEEAARASMLAALRAGALFTEPGHWHHTDEVKALAAPRHARLMARWLVALERAGWLTSDGERYRLAPGAAPPAAEQAWDALARAWDERLGAPALHAYLREHADRLADVMNDRVEPSQLLFPAGDLARAEAAYASHVMARYMNGVVAAVTAELAASQRVPLRILELGAGIGATSRAVWAALGDRPYDYLYTDVGAFFLEQTRARASQDARLRLQRVDIDLPLREQGLPECSFDVVIAAGVLDNARDVAATLAEIRAVLAPRGVLLLTEPTAEHDEILISQAFMMTEPTDVRARDNRTFLDRAAWQGQLRAQGGRVEVCLPEPAHPLAALGQHVFCARFHEDVCPVDVSRILEGLRARLPDYMVPQRLLPVHALPLSDNGKVDRARLAAWATRDAIAPSAHVVGRQGPRDPLEQALCDVFAGALPRGAPSPADNLFELGADSLLLAQVAAKVIDAVPEASGRHFDAVLRELINRPRIEDLATFLRAGTTDAAADASDARAGGALWLSGTAAVPPEEVLDVLVHEGIGTMSPYRALLGSLATRTGWLGLVVDDAQAYLRIPAEQLVSELAAAHVQTLLATGQRRFRLAGYCLGGQLAVEIARQLADRGVWVERLTVISSSPPSFVVSDELLIEHTFAKVLGADLARAGYVADDEGLGRALRAVLAKTPGHVEQGALAGLDDVAHAGIPATLARLATRPQAERLRAAALTCHEGEHAVALYPVFRHAFEAASRHRSAPFAGDIQVLRPRDRLRFLVGLDLDPEAYWRDVCLGELTIADVPGDHFSCMRAPAVDAVRDALRGAP